MRLHSPAITGSLTLSSSVMTFDGNGIQIGTAGNTVDQPLRVNNRIMIHQDSGGAGDSELHFDRRHDGADARIKAVAGAGGAYATELHFVTTHASSGEQTALQLDDNGHIYSDLANIKISGSATSTGSFAMVHAANKLGIGTQSPSTKFHVKETASSTDVIARLEATGDVYLQFVANNELDWAFIHGYPDTTDFALYNYSNNRNDITVLDANGNVGIGVADPDVSLEVAGDVKIEKGTNASTQNVMGIGRAGNIESSGGGNAFITVHGNTNNQSGQIELGSANLVGDGSRMGRVFFYNLDGGSSVVSRAQITAERDGADDASKLIFATEPTSGDITDGMILDSNGNLKVQGDITAETLIISSSVTNLTTQFASGSTRFGDTSDDIHEFTGSLRLTGSGIVVESATDWNPSVQIISRYDNDRSPALSLKNLTGGTDGDGIGKIEFYGKDNTGTERLMSKIEGRGTDVSEYDSAIEFYTAIGGTVAKRFEINENKISGSSTSTGSFGSLDINTKRNNTALVNVTSRANNNTGGISLQLDSTDAASLRQYYDGTNWQIASTYGTQGGLYSLTIHGSAGSGNGLKVMKSTYAIPGAIGISAGSGTNLTAMSPKGALHVSSSTMGDALVVSGSGGFPRVGIGTTSPSKALVVETTSDYDGIEVRDVNAVARIANGSLDDGYIQLLKGGTGIVQIHSGGDTYFNAANQQVGIGTTSPAAHLHLEADEPEFFLKHTGTSGDDKTTITWGDKHGQAHGKLFTQLKDDSSGGAYDSEFHIQTAAGGTLADRIVVDADGNTTIGTTTTSTRKLSLGGTLHVSRSDASTGYTTHGHARYIEIGTVTTGGGGIVWRKQSSNISRGLVVNQGYMYFIRSTADDSSAAPTYDMTILPSGNVGIGTTSPGQILHISSSGNIKSTIESAGSSAGVQIKSAGEDYNSSLEFLSAGSSNGQIYYDHHATAGSQKMIFQVGDGAVNAMAIDGSGNVGIGTTSPSAQLNVVSSRAVTDNTGVYLSDFSFTKTGGDADQSTSIIGTRASAIHNDSNSGFGNIVGGDFYATNTQNKNSAGNGDNIIAVGANASHVAGIVNTVNGLNTYVNVDAGTIDQYVVGNNITLDIENGVNVAGNVYGEKIYMDVDDTNAAEVWGIEIDNVSSANWDGYINASKGTGTGYAISGSALSTGSFGKVYAATYVERPTSPAFQITSNATSENTDLALSTTTHVTMSREVFDNGGNVANSVFTAPVTGKYQLQFTTKLLNIDSAGQYVALYLFTSNRTYTSQYEPDKLFSADCDYHTIHMQALCDMDAGDTAYIGIRPQGGTAQMDLEGDSGASVTHFSGFLI